MMPRLERVDRFVQRSGDRSAGWKARRGPKGKRDASHTGGFVVRVMKVNAASFRMRDRAALVFRQRQRCARQADLAEHGQYDCARPQLANERRER